MPVIPAIWEGETGDHGSRPAWAKVSETLSQMLYDVVFQT
jgi:hypothetical protein